MAERLDKKEAIVDEEVAATADRIVHLLNGKRGSFL